MDKRCCRNRDSMRLFGMRTTVDTSNRSRCRFQTTTTPRLQSLLRASIVETPVLCSVPDHNLFARQTSASEMPKKVLPQKAQKAQKFSLMLTRSIPLALKGEGGPVMWLAPAWILRHRDLRGAECCGGSKLLAEHCFVKAFHKFSRGAIVDLPETCDHTRRAGVHETARQSDKSFAANFFSERRLTCAQHDEIRRQFQVERMSD